MGQGRASGLIREYRRKAGLTQRQLADAARVSIGVVRDLEQGRTAHLQAESARRLAIALHLDQRQAAELTLAVRFSSGSAPPVPNVALRLSVLGPLRAWRDGAEIALGGVMPRAVLGLLVLYPEAGQHRNSLVDALWGGDPPATAAAMIQSYVSRLRRCLAPGGPACQPEGLLVATAGGYRLRAAACELDHVTFTALASRGRDAQTAGDLAGACEAYARALGLWQGEPLADVEALRDHPAVAGLSQQRAAVITGYAEAASAAGWHDRALAELRELAGREPLNERAHARLMIALAATGHQAAALGVYEQLRRRLDDQLGVRPGSELADAHSRVLRQRIPSAPSPGACVAVLPPAGGGTSQARLDPEAPRQLPGGTAHFVGREAELKALTGTLGQVSATGRTVMISAIGGTAGVGKTALAVHWAHQVADQFPDGQLYVNLRGFGPSSTPVPAQQAIRCLLDALGVPAGRIPADPDARAGLYRSLLAGKRVLIVLDNGRDAEQVRPLLPGTSGCLVIITSRNQLAGLAATEGARALTLDVLSEAEACQLLASRLGAARVAAEPAAVAELVSLCARLPLALSITAARAAARPSFPLAVLAADVRDASGRLDALECGEPAASIRAVFSWSCRYLSPPAAQMFWLLSIHPGPDITVPAAATLAAVATRPARRALDELTGASLLAEHVPGRYAFHDLLRAYAAEQAGARDRGTERRAANRRMLDHYLYAGHAADRLLYPARDPITLAPPAAGIVPERLADHRQALAWFRDEHRVLLAVIARAAETGFDTHASQLPRILVTFLDPQGYWQDLAAIQQTALTAAQRLGDRAGQAWAHRLLGRAHVRLGSLALAHAHLSRALDLYRDLGDKGGAAHVHTYLAKLAEIERRYVTGLSHAEQGLRLFRACGNTAGEARALNSVGWCHTKLGDYQLALDRCQQALDLHTRLGNRQGQAATWDSIGYACHHLGNYPQAITSYRRALDLFRDLGNRYEEAETLIRLGDTSLTAGDPAAAQGSWRRAVIILEDLHPAEAEAVRGKLTLLQV